MNPNLGGSSKQPPGGMSGMQTREARVISRSKKKNLPAKLSMEILVGSDRGPYFMVYIYMIIPTYPGVRLSSRINPKPMRFCSSLLRKNSYVCPMDPILDNTFISKKKRWAFLENQYSTCFVKET